MSKEEAVNKAYEDYENPDFINEDATPFEILRKEKMKSDKIPLHERTKAKGKTFWDLWKPRDITATEEGKALYERAQKKAKNAKSLDEFTFSELIELKPKDVAQMSPELQEKFKKIAPDLVKRSEMISKTAAIPFIGGVIEERLREKLAPGTPPPPPIADISRIAGELPFIPAVLGGEGLSLLEKGIRGAAFFGGDAALNEVIRTIGTEKPVNLSSIGIQTLIGGMFPYAEAGIKSIASPLRKALAKEMQTTKKEAGEALGKVFERAKKSGVNFEDLEKGSQNEAKKFSKFLSEDAKETSSKLGKTQKTFSESGKQAEKRFLSESKAISETPLEKYFEPEKIKKTGYDQRKSLLQPRISKNESRINELQKELLKKTGSELQEVRKELSSLKETNRKLSYQIKYDKLPPTPEELKKNVEDSINRIFNDILHPSEEGAKRMATNSKMMDTFLKKAKEELVKGNLPDKFIEDTFLNINKEYLKGYKNLKNEIESLLKDSSSLLYKSKEGPPILENLEKRIKGIEAALQTQEQKRKALRALKGPTGQFYRKSIDDLRKTNQLFSKDSIRIGDKIKESEKNISYSVKEKLEKLGSKLFNADKKTFIKEGEKIGMSSKEATNLKDALEEIKNPKRKFNSYEERRNWMKGRVNEILKTTKNQLIAGFVIGSIDSLIKEVTGKKLPPTIKNVAYGLAGFAGQKGSNKRPFLALSAWISDALLKSARKKYYSSTLKAKRGSERREQYEKIKKKGFTQKDLKEIRSAR